jgi:hypothetical protein
VKVEGVPPDDPKVDLAASPGHAELSPILAEPALLLRPDWDRLPSILKLRIRNIT